jgi:hypothetical protein
MYKTLDPHAIVLDKLQDDVNYYGEYGKQFLSYSDIIVLLKSPDAYRQPVAKTKAMIEGSYFHTAMLEPDRIDEYQIVDVASRSTKAYKEACKEGEIILLKKEEAHLQTLVKKMKGNFEMYEILYAKGNQFEKPETSHIMNHMWKGKADIVSEKSFQVEVQDEQGKNHVMDYPNGAVIDIKTTNDISKFRFSARTYNYDAQAYVYQRLFNKPMLFFVIDKQTLRLGIRPVSPAFVEEGQRKVELATQIYEKFFSDEATHDISTYIDKQLL